MGSVQRKSIPVCVLCKAEYDRFSDLILISHPGIPKRLIKVNEPQLFGSKDCLKVIFLLKTKGHGTFNKKPLDEVFIRSTKVPSHILFYKSRCLCHRLFVKLRIRVIGNQSYRAENRLLLSVVRQLIIELSFQHFAFVLFDIKFKPYGILGIQYISVGIDIGISLQLLGGFELPEFFYDGFFEFLRFHGKGIGS